MGFGLSSSPSARDLLCSDVGGGLEQLEGYQEMQQAADAAYHTEAVIDVAFHGRIIQLSGITLFNGLAVSRPLSRTFITFGSPGREPARIADLHSDSRALRSGDPTSRGGIPHSF